MKNRINSYSNMGKLTIMIGVLIMCPVLVIPFYPEDIKYLPAFLIPGGFSVLLGILICFFRRKRREEAAFITTHKGNVMVLYIWIYGALLGAVPFIISGKLSVTQGIFEAVSGWTTTGLSVMDVSVTPQIFLFYRSFMQFCGGLGFVMIMTAFFQGKLATQLYYAEGHSDRIKPTLKSTVQIICAIYLVCLIVGVIVYRLCGMPVFDGIIHAMGALSTGGFSNQVDSIGAYQSLSIELVTIILMIIGTTNFAVLVLIAGRRWDEVVKNSELRFLAVLLGIFVPLVGISLSGALYMSFGEGVRQSIFNIVSALSTSGFSTMSYSGWPAFSIGVMILMMLIGGGLGSTAGGIKLSRVYIMLKASWKNIKSKVSAEHECKNLYYYRAQGKTKIDNVVLNSTSGFITVYLLLFVMGSLLICLTADVSLTEGMFEFASSIGTVGLSIGITGTETNALTLIVEIFGMLLGRLEIFIILTGIYSTVFLVRRKCRIDLSHYLGYHKSIKNRGR